MMRKLSHSFFIILLIITACQNDDSNILKQGMIISKSTTFPKDTLYFGGGDEPVLTIEGEDIIIDFGGTMIVGNSNMEKSDLLKGVGLKVIGKRIIVKNLIIKGFEQGIHAKNTPNLTLENIHTSYNYKPNYFENCDESIIRNCTATNGRNALVLKDCNNGMIYNNTFQFNSGTGIHLINSSNNQIMHNRLDWNTSSLLFVSKSEKNIIAYNSMTHGANGLQDLKMENYVYKNDLSYSLNTADTLSSKAIIKEIEPLKDGQATELPVGTLVGKQYILVNEWGFYDFKSPSIWLRSIENDTYTFLLLGPEGNWKSIGASNVSYLSLKRGNFPATLIAKKIDAKKPLTIDLQFIGSEFMTQFGEFIQRGQPYSFGYHEDLE